MKKFKKLNLNQILIIVTIILIVIAIIAVSLFLFTKDKEEEINYEDTITAKNYFSEITVDLGKRNVKIDNETTTLKEEFNISEEKEALILSSEEALREFFLDSTFDINVKGNVAYITNKYQTKKILVEVSELKGNFKDAKVDEIEDKIYVLTYDTQKRTKEAYEYLKNISWIKKVENDEVIKIQTINDESQTVYGNNENNEENEKSYGIKEMGLNNYKNIIEENGNPSSITVATIGYGAAIDNSYFGGRISDNSYNFFEESKNIKETVAQGSRILEVIQESTTHNVKIMPLVVVNEKNYTTVSSIVKAIAYATKNSDVICYELVHKQNYMIDLMLKNAFKENIPTCAVTTSEVSEENDYPANNSTTIAVASLDKETKITNYSGKGEYIDFAAYSTDVQEIFNTSSSVSKWSGSEYANAHIVSAIALIKTYHKEYTILEIYNFLRNYCKDLGEEGRDKEYGYGCPNFSELKISDIDKTSPQIGNVTLDNEKWEKAKKIQIKANDEIRILGWAITDSDEEPGEWQKLEVLSTNLEANTDIDKNGKYYIWVIDSAGNKTKKDIEISKIDNTGPAIQNTVDTSKLNTEKYVTINVTATDNESGLNEIAYSWDGTAWGRDNYQLKVTENGKHTIFVRDKLENISQKDIVINQFPKEGKAIIEDGSIIKSIDVSSEWNGDINSAVKIVFSDNLNIDKWKITQTTETPADFFTADLNNSNDLELEDEDYNTITNSVNRNTNTNTTNSTIDNGSTSVIINRPNTSNQNTVQGYSNITITVSLQVDTQYYVWIKDKNGNVGCQGFRITK